MIKCGMIIVVVKIHYRPPLPHGHAMNPLSLSGGPLPFVLYPHGPKGFWWERAKNGRLELTQRCRKLTSTSAQKNSMQCEARTRQYKHLRPRGMPADTIARPQCQVSHFDMMYEIYTAQEYFTPCCCASSSHFKVCPCLGAMT